MQLIVTQNEKNFINEAVKFIQKSLKAKKTASIALSGGSTPVKIYKALASLASLSSAQFYQTDERFVPPTHQDSNQKMITKSLVNRVTKGKFHHFNTSLPIKNSLREYSKTLPPKFDLTILGIGPDGHIASLFPHTKALTSKAKTAHTTTKKFAIKDRLTLTFLPIIASHKTLVLLKGPEKLEIIKKLQAPHTLTIKNFPAKKLLKHKDLTIIFCPV